MINLFPREKNYENIPMCISGDNQTSKMIGDINKILSENAKDSVYQPKDDKNDPKPDQDQSITTSVPEVAWKQLWTFVVLQAKIRHSYSNGSPHCIF